MADQQVVTESIRWLGETRGFWIQTGAFFLSALGAIALIYNSHHQAKKRATIDLALHEFQNQNLIDAKSQVQKYRQEGIDFTGLACGDPHSKPENKYIQVFLNNYEFIASGIKEGAFDEEIYKRMKRSLIIRDWDAFSAYIAELRRNQGRSQLFIEFEWLAQRWKDKPIKPDVGWWRKVITWLGL